MFLYFRLLGESLSFALNALRNNKLRTFLSLLGVTIGIFSIIAVLAAVDSMKKNIEGSLSGMDMNTVYLFKYSFGPSDIPQWKREQFPNVTYEEYQYLKKNLNDVDQISFNFFTRNESIKYEDNIVTSIRVKPSTFEFFDIEPFTVEKGRLFNESESNSGVPVIVIGHDVAEGLFQNNDPLGKQIRLYGQRFKVIGVLKKQGQDTFGDSNDVAVFFPVNFMRKMYGDNNKTFTPAILIKPEKGIDVEEFKAELTQKLRSHRGLKPNDIDNFFINVLSGFTEFIDNITGQMNVVGWILSGFSLLVGGFGIANIMFVSVKERTNLIGIQKALGAKNKFILFQFLFEAIILSLFGGLIGMFLVWIIAIILTNVLEFEFVLSLANIILGSGLAILIGLIAGIIPAISASKLDPVEAIRTGM
ncbi:Probable ABC-type transport system, permease component [Flavobacterium indicum GPTSA100-9 = DSM 17447]|uniref:Probable ABC-type transport system, permease component n=1 Tax=Flavobacterium indicum (strain DSM 17447 / CIP 109464 / GPTSA100-9) TaxID=1094466 RepID=H8XQE9_FLAIG|nr:ABC transporter permease [Flavobacterium indicum]CCG52443.1 Probable ABC-type transport system, permease component [Flavobacterium indicum GPTSA100-9 = DSM 17447]